MSLILLLLTTAVANVPDDPTLIKKLTGLYQAFGPSPTECEEPWQNFFLKADEGVLTLGPSAEASPEDFQVNPESMFSLQTDYGDETFYLSTSAGCFFRKLR